MIRAWLKKRREAKEKEAFATGFGWAMAAYHIEDKTIPEIECYLDWEHTAIDHFDQGAKEAVRNIERAERLQRVEEIFNDSPDLTWGVAQRLFAEELRDAERVAARHGYICGCQDVGENVNATYDRSADEYISDWHPRKEKNDE